MTTARIPLSAVLDIHAALVRACADVPYTTDSTALWHDLNKARALVATYFGVDAIDVIVKDDRNAA